MAVFILPPGMIGFYKQHIDYIEKRSVAPDKRRHTVKEEACRHYIDLDHYGTHPFDSIPKTWKAACLKYSEDSLQAYGIVPWQINLMVYELTEAFRKKEIESILRLSAELGHYVADAHVPLHTTENYNGQLTNQKGIHAFWESRIPEMFADGYDYYTGRAVYIDDPLAFAWEAVKASFQAKDSVLLFEEGLNSTFPSDKKYGMVKKGNRFVKDYSDEYTMAYNLLLKGQVERRLRASIHAVGSLWYTAWVNAGQPDLKMLYDRKLEDSTKVINKEYIEQIVNENKPIGGHED